MRGYCQPLPQSPVLTTLAEIPLIRSRLRPNSTYLRRSRFGSLAASAMADTHVAHLALAGHPARGGTLFPYTPSEHPCGVEIFTRTLTAALRANGGAYELLPVSGRLRELPSLAWRIAHANRIVFSFPLVAWKRMLALPLVLLLIAVASRCRVTVLLHEWTALHWLRRAVLAPFVLLSGRIVLLSPYIRDQIANDPWLPGAAAKCRLIPHPPTIRRPDRRTVSERVQRIERAAESCDMVIGSFGSIYKGKQSDALLDIAAHLRTRGIRALVVLAGSFTSSLDGYENEFRACVAQLALDEQVIVTGYIE